MSQPLPDWRRNQLARDEAARDLAARNHLGVIMGFDDDTADDQTRARCFGCKQFHPFHTLTTPPGGGPTLLCASCLTAFVRDLEARR